MEYNYPEKLPLLKFLLNAKALTKNPIPFHKQYFDEYGDSFTVANSKKRKIFLTRDADIARRVLQQNHKNYKKSEIQTKFLSKYVGYGLLTSNGAYWKKQRRLIQPAFHKKKLEGLIGIIVAAINEEIARIPKNKFVDVYQIMNELAFNVVAKSLFSFAADKETLQRLQVIIADLQLFIVKELRQPHKRWWYHLSGQVKSKLKLSQESRAIILDIINQRRAANTDHDDLLDMLLKATYEDGTGMTNEQLIDEILILFVAGHETTANALTFALHLLGSNPGYISRVRKEGFTSKKNWNLEELSELKLIKAIVEETMRLYPPAWITDRVAIEDDVVGPYCIHKGAILGISFYEIHRDKKYWDNPNQFIPERFLDDKAKESKQYYYPFGAGPRMCIGNNFAMYEMMLVVHNLLESYSVEVKSKEIKINPLVTLKPENAWMKFVPINE